MKQVIALVGRPNVGKSTLFNKLTKTRDALVADFPGLTRDRKYGDADVYEREFIVIDTGGIGENGLGENKIDIDDEMSQQSIQAIDEADVVFFLVDARAGLTVADQEIGKLLRTKEKEIHLLVNKVDGIDEDQAIGDFYQLGFESIHGIAASQSRGLRQLIEKTIEPAQFLEEDEEAGIKMAIIGRPNVGKSTLVNRMLGEERVIVFDMPGTTRDSIYIPYERMDKKYTIIDTAGVRKRGRIKQTVEKFSIIKSLQAIDDAHVVILVIDGSEKLVEQDLHLLGYAIQKGRAIVIAINKWDGLEDEHKAYVKTELKRRLVFIQYANTHFISALHGTGVGEMYPSIHAAYEASQKRFSASQLTQLMEELLAEHQPPLVNGRRIKLRFAHMGGTMPPTIVIHGNQTKSIPDSYKKYLEKGFRKYLGYEGTPVKVEFRTGDNPYAKKPNTRIISSKSKKSDKGKKPRTRS